MDLTQALQLITTDTEFNQVQLERMDGTEVSYYRASVYDELYGYGRDASEAIVDLASNLQKLSEGVK